MAVDEYIRCKNRSVLSRTSALANSICAVLCQEDRNYLADITVHHESKQTGWLSELDLLSRDEVCICLSRTIHIPNAFLDFVDVSMYIYPEAYIQGSSMSVMLLDRWRGFSRKYFETVLGYQYLPPVTGEVLNAGYYLNEAETKRVTEIKDPFERFMAFIHLVKRFSADVTEYLRDNCKGTPTKTLLEMYKERNTDRVRFKVQQSEKLERVKAY